MFAGADAFNDGKSLQQLDAFQYDTPAKASNQ